MSTLTTTGRTTRAMAPSRKRELPGIPHPNKPAELQAASSPKAVNRQSIEVAMLPDALLRLATVSDVVGLSPATIYRRVLTKEFPEPVRLGKRCTRWKSAAIQTWLAAQ